MKSAAVVLVVLFSTAGIRAQEPRTHREHRSAPPAPFVPQSLSTGGITTLPPPPPLSPFAARPDTYSPQYNQPPFRAGQGRGVSIYNGTLGFSPYAWPMAPPPVPDQKPAPPVPAPEPPKVLEPPKAAPPLLEPAPEPPPRVAVAHGPDTFYVIPGCYAGNVLPIPERLLNGCDLAKMRTIPVR